MYSRDGLEQTGEQCLTFSLLLILSLLGVFLSYSLLLASLSVFLLDLVFDTLDVVLHDLRLVFVFETKSFIFDNFLLHLFLSLGTKAIISSFFGHVFYARSGFMSPTR